jgi:catechol 2,3-dioxygenase-like lactoylglutathione lyase family enzyme
VADPERHGLVALDHVNIRTARVDALAAFYCDVLGLTRGPRPPFPFAGAWLYCGDGAVVHLVEAPAPLASIATVEPSLSHFAFRATGLAAFVARLREAGVPHRVACLPGSRVVQVNLRDLDGNALHVDFDEAAADVPS